MHPLTVRIAFVLASVFVFALSSFGSVFAADMPKAERYAVPGEHSVPMLSYPLRKGCYGLSKVRSMTLLYKGSSSKNIRTVYAKVLGKTVTRKRVINPETDTVTLWFSATHAPSLCYSGSIDIYADFSKTAEKGSFHSLEVEFGTDVMTDEGSVGAIVYGPWVKVVRKKGE